MEPIQLQVLEQTLQRAINEVYANTGPSPVLIEIRKALTMVKEAKRSGA